MELQNKRIEHSIGFVYGNKFHSSQFNDRFKDILANKAVVPISLDVAEKGATFELTLLEGVVVDHRGIRYNFGESVPLKTEFKKDLEGKKYVRLAGYYDNTIRRNYKIELRHFFIDDLDSYEGTSSDDDKLFFLETFEVTGGRLKSVEQIPTYTDGSNAPNMTDIDGRIKEEIAMIEKQINNKEKNLTTRIDKDFRELSDRIDETRRDASNSIDCLQDNYTSLSNQLINLGLGVRPGPVCSFGDDASGGELPELPEPPVKRDRVGLKRENKDEEGTFISVKTTDQFNDTLSESKLVNFEEGKYRKRIVRMNVGTPAEVKYELELIYDEDGDLIEERLLEG